MNMNHVFGPNQSDLRVGPKRWHGRTVGRTKRADDETGALLILALIFLVVISALCASLSLWATNNLNNTGKFATSLSLQSASNSITQLAVQDVRYNFSDSTLNTSPPQPCWTSAPPLAPVSQQQFGAVNVAVWCTTQWNPLSADTRVVTFTACPETAFPNGTLAGTINAAATACAANPFLEAVVEFDDFPTSISADNCLPLSNTTCGTTFTVLSWAFDPLVPSVATITVSPSTTAQCTSSREIDITGTNLTGASSVNVIQSAANNVVFPAGLVPSLTTATSLTACAVPQMEPGVAYSLTVTTPNGTSAAVPFAYNFIVG